MNELVLCDAALEARSLAYAPYSKYQVGAAVLTVSNELYLGSNIENASYGLTVCAERSAIFQAVLKGNREIAAVAIVTEDAGTPCGACRQVMSEFAPRDGRPMLVITLDKLGNIGIRTTLGELLPQAFRLNAT